MFSNENQREKPVINARNQFSIGAKTGNCGIGAVLKGKHPSGALLAAYSTQDQAAMQPRVQAGVQSLEPPGSSQNHAGMTHEWASRMYPGIIKVSA